MELTCFPRTAHSITSSVVIAPRLGHVSGSGKIVRRCGAFTTARRSTLQRAGDLPSARVDHGRRVDELWIKLGRSGTGIAAEQALDRSARPISSLTIRLRL